MKNTYVYLFLPFLLLSVRIFAQPINDDCIGLIDLGEAPICPAVLDTFNNIDATPSMISSSPQLEIPACFQGASVDRDVWFQFTVPADGSLVDFDITATGVNGPNGMMQQPQIAIYRGQCLLDELQELACATAALGESEVMVNAVGLTPGLDYFLRINDWSASASLNSGDFVLCIAEPPSIFTMGEDTESNACSGTLFDSGGPDGEYSNNEDNVFTICPSELTGCITIDLLPSIIETNFDNLTFYEGTDINGQEVLNFTGNSSATTFQIGDGCVTVQFTSDVSVTNPGFELNWECEIAPCTTTLLPCNEVETILALPFNSPNSTCEAGDDLQTGPCGDEVLQGEDYTYSFTPNFTGCINITVGEIEANTWISVYNGCPESAATCFAQEQNTTGDSLKILNLLVSAFDPIFIVLSNPNCTDFFINVEQVPCIETVGAATFCETAFLLNRCIELPEIFEISQQTTTIDTYFQEGINDGCWEGIGAGHITWLFFQAQSDGEFGFLAQNINPDELANIDIQVWGPIDNPNNICEFMANNQPARSTAAAGNSSPGVPDLTGLVNENPQNGTAVIDECESSDGDGFITTLPVVDQGIYLIFINDFSGNVSNDGINLDFSPTTPGVLDGLSADSPFTNTEFVFVGDALYTPINQDFSCIQMTAAINTQLSCAWQPEPVDFSAPFTNTVTMYFGENDGGADGICMVYQQSPEGLSACGISGGEIGAGTIDNSLIIEFDTWQNVDFGDPFQDHIAVNINGDMTNPIAGPAIQPNLENGQEYQVAFTWDPFTNTFEVLVNGVLQVTGVYDLINDVFDGSNTAFCGYTASTGGANNLQYVCTGQTIYPANKLDTVTVVLCEGETYFAEGMEQTTSGIYTDVFNAFNGCDSTIVTDLTFQTSSSDTVAITLCMGESIFVGGALQNSAGIYVDNFLSAGGCDSLVVTNLSFLPSAFTPVTFELCEGEFIFVGGAEQTMSGTYVDTLTSSNGCDSLIFSEVNFLANFSENIQITLCQGESFFVGGAEQTTTGTYTDTFQSTGGCDSIVTTDLSFFAAEINVLQPDLVNCEMNCVTIDASDSATNDSTTYLWTAPAEGNILEGETTTSPTVCGAGIYDFQLTTTTPDLTCVQNLEITVNFDETISCGYNIPNAFTPNGDGINDVFELVSEGSSNTVQSLIIYNRWGKEVHNGKGETHAWDGKLDGEPATADVYIYIFEIENFAGAVTVEKGDITLIR